MITVDGQAYRITGEGLQIEPAVQLAATMTPTRTSFLFQAGPVTVNATFLSPVEVRQNLSLKMMLYALFETCFSSQRILYNNPFLSRTTIYQ